MARDITPASGKTDGAATPSERRRDAAHGGGGALKGTAEAIGALYAAVAGLAIGGVESWTDRRAEARSARLRSRAASGRPRRPAGDARRGIGA